LDNQLGHGAHLIHVRVLPIAQIGFHITESLEQQIIAGDL